MTEHLLKQVKRQFLAYRIATLEDVILEFSAKTDPYTGNRIHKLLDKTKEELKLLE